MCCLSHLVFDKGDDSVPMKKKIVSTVFIVACISLMLVVIPQAKGVQFYLATWSYPDEYGQGIHTWYADSNATGSWVTFEAANYLESTGPIPWNVSQAIRIMVWASMNRTLLGLNDTDVGKNHIQHNVTVTDQWDIEVFSQQNFTFDYVAVEGEMYWYRHVVILNFLPLEGEFYTVTILCYIYW